MKMGLFNLKKIWFVGAITFLLGGSVALPVSVAYAQSSTLTLTQSERAALEAELAQLQAEMAEKQKELAGQQQYSGTLAGDIKVLTAKINAKKSEISVKNTKIKQLTVSIVEKKATIVSLSDKIDKQRQSLAQLIRKTNEMDKANLTSFLLSSHSLSEFYTDVARYDKLKQEVKSSVDSIKEIKGITEVTKSKLEKEQDQTLDEKKALESVQKSIESDKKTQQQLLSISKNKEAEYAKLIASQEKRANEIKAKLFNLAGGSQAIRFDVALGYAKSAGEQTGIEPAFVLAILTQESNLGANVGKCYLTNTDTGEGISTTTGKVFSNVMKPTRDVPPFLEITSKLGYSASKTVVSCPIAGVAGWGGAMGPAQFIASTWKLFESRLQSALGHYANPWSAQDAFMASAMYLSDLGASGSSYSAQIRAACKYYGTGGSTCSYGRSVMNLKAKIQSDIDYLNQYGVSRR